MVNPLTLLAVAVRHLPVSKCALLLLLCAPFVGWGKDDSAVKSKSSADKKQEDLSPQEMVKSQLGETYFDSESFQERLVERRESHLDKKKDPDLRELFLEKQDKELKALHRNAQMAALTSDIPAAEESYFKLLSKDIQDSLRAEVFLEMAQMYQKLDERVKVVAVYEKFGELFPNHDKLPETYIKLGLLYREMGAPKMAMNRFYDVLNSALSVDRKEIQGYRDLALKARFEIAETCFAQGDFVKAEEFYKRLKKVKLDPEDQAVVLFKSAYVQYLQQNYPPVIDTLTTFIKDYPDNKLTPEAYFILADSYRQTGDPKKSVEQVLELLRKSQDRAGLSAKAWNYWKKRTGNQLANEFYKNGDFINALTIYQHMVPLSDNPQWQWPIVYQIGLCFERLNMPLKARDAYEVLTQPEKPVKINQKLASLQQMATWRLEHVNWLTTAEKKEKEMRDFFASKKPEPKVDSSVPKDD